MNSPIQKASAWITLVPIHNYLVPICLFQSTTRSLVMHQTIGTGNKIVTHNKIELTTTSRTEQN